jgi:hypothetical protein
VFKGIDKKRHTRTPYEIHNLEGIIRKDIFMLMHLTKDTSAALTKGQEEFSKS